MVAFFDIITAANFTTQSLRNLFCLNSISYGERWSQTAYWPLVMKRSGWNVYLYSNQFVPAATKVGLEGMMCDPLLMDECYSAVADSNFVFDGDFRDYVTRRFVPSESGERRLVIWHLYGQHFPSYTRYPQTDENECFTSADVTADLPWLDNEKRKEVAEYANATRYNDAVVASIIDLYRATPAIVIYFSDHGEEMWDTAPYGARNSQHPDDVGWMHRQFDVPFFVWFSEKFAASWPEVVGRIHEAAGRKGTLDDLGYMILGLAGIADSTVYDSRRDILSDLYYCLPRVTSAGYKYDREPI